MAAFVPFAVALGAITTLVSSTPLQPRSVFCTPGEGLCALGIQTNPDGSSDVTVYNDACNQIGGTTFKSGFSSLDSQLPFTLEIRNNDPHGAGTKFDYAGLGFGPGNGRNRWGCASCGDGGKSQCCGYYFVGPGCNAPWDKAHCTTAPITDAAWDRDVQWASVGAEDAWNAAVNAWKSNPSPGGLNFPEHISNFFHGPPNMNCQATSDGNGCKQAIQCDETGHPAGHLIINSLVAVSELLQNMYDGIQHSESDITTDIAGFSSTFAPIVDTQKDLKLLLDIVGLGFALAASPIWNSALKIAFKNSPNTIGTLKDMVNPLVSNGITIAKDLSSATLQAQNTLEEDMGKLVILWQNSISNLKKKLFSGDADSISQLHSMITNGKMLNPGGFLDDPTIKGYVEKALFAHLIPEAWSLSNKDIHPVIIDAQVPCGTVAPKTVVDFLPKVSDGDGNWGCDNGKLYYMFQVTGSPAHCPQGKDRICNEPFMLKLPGVETLDGKAWGGLIKDDFIQGALAGYAANGNKNGWQIADPSNADTLNSISTNSVRTAGVINIPVCTAQEAYDNWSKALGRKGANWPCNG